IGRYNTLAWLCSVGTEHLNLLCSSLDSVKDQLHELVGRFPAPALIGRIETVCLDQCPQSRNIQLLQCSAQPLTSSLSQHLEGVQRRCGLALSWEAGRGMPGE